MKRTNNQIDAVATRMSAPDVVQHLYAMAKAGRLTANEATRKAPGGWGFSYDRNGELQIVYIPE